jgi:SAM-dependent methyltransferase
MGGALYHAPPRRLRTGSAAANPAAPVHFGDGYNAASIRRDLGARALSEPLFDLAAEYGQLLDQGLRLSGESRDFFLRGRVAELLRQLPEGFRAGRILDFGCGTGDTSRHLASVFPMAEVVGVDNAANALGWAASHHAGPRVRFEHLDGFDASGEFDLCYVNGVFHHIAPERRPGAVGRLSRALRAGGWLALFENNPWNPGTRMVMRRIPFDRDAIPLAPPETRRLVVSAGLRVIRTRSLFYFPRALAFLRPLEGRLGSLPLGAQYYVLGVKA